MSCYQSALNDCVAVAPSRQTPLCEGVEDTIVSCHNESTCVLTSNYAIEFSSNAGGSWQRAGLLGPMETAQFYRRSGELWRLRNVYNGHVVGPALTNQTAVRLVTY